MIHSSRHPLREAEEPARRPAVDPRVIHAVQSALPGLDPASLEWVGEGDDFLALGMGGKWVIRYPKHPAAALGLRREACVLPQLAAHLPMRIPVTRVVPAGPRASDVVGIQRRVPGHGLSRERWAALPSRSRRRQARLVGQFLRALHLRDPGIATGCGLSSRNVPTRVEGLRRRLASAEGERLPEGLREGARRVLEAAGVSTAFASVLMRLLHGDLSPDHVLATDPGARLSGVIDWGDLRMGDPAFDFVYVLEDWGPDFLRHSLDAYAPSEPHLFRGRILVHSLMENLAWTLDTWEGGGSVVGEGLGNVEMALAELARIPGAPGS